MHMEIILKVVPYMMGLISLLSILLGLTLQDKRDRYIFTHHHPRAYMMSNHTTHYSNSTSYGVTNTSTFDLSDHVEKIDIPAKYSMMLIILFQFIVPIVFFVGAIQLYRNLKYNGF